MDHENIYAVLDETRRELRESQEIVGRVCNERDRALAEIERLRAALRAMLCELECEVPAANCGCHVSPPCSDCTNWSGAREAVKEARAALEAP